MMYITFAAMLILAAGAVCSLYRQLQILQCNDYRFSKYLKWVYNSYFAELAVSSVIYCATMFLVLNKKDVLVLVLSVLLLASRIVLNILTYKKTKLTFCARIKRIYIIAIIVLGILVLASAMSFDNTTNIISVGNGYLIGNNIAGEVVRTICILLSIVTPTLTMVIWPADHLIEKTIAKRNIKDSHKDEGAKL